MALFRDNWELNIDPRAPERSHLALSRLIPWLRPRRRDDETVELRLYTLGPGQNPLEIRLTGFLFNLTWTLLLYSAAWHLFEIRGILVPLTLLVSIALVPVVILILMLLAEPLVRMFSRLSNADAASTHSFMQQAILLFACIEAAFDSHWIRWVGLTWIVLVSLELIARLVEIVRNDMEDEPSAS